jgi:DNA-binding transcriptional regulator LsrR (DeoR family)
MGRIDDLRLVTRVARLYHERGFSQPEIALQLHISQAKVSRLLKRAVEDGIVRTTVTVPLGIHVDLEDALQARYRLQDVVVADSLVDDDGSVLRDIGAAAAHYLETTVSPTDIVGISSWSATLLAMVDSMQPSTARAARVVQILGGVGNPSAEVHATQLTRRLAQLLRAEATLLPAPGVVGSAEARDVLNEDIFVARAMRYFAQITVALVGIGTVEPSSLLASSGNIFSAAELESLRAAGAAGDICLRFFDQHGQAVETALDRRVIGMDMAQLGRVDRAIAVAGGPRKRAAIRAALAGGLIRGLITDRFTAEKLLADSDSDSDSNPHADAGESPAGPSAAALR